MTSQVKLTRVMADPYGDLPPHAYIVYKQSQLCRCGHLHQWSTMMTETHIRSTLQQGKYSTIHRKVDEVKYNLPIARVIEAQTERVLFCHECYATAKLSHLPPPPKPQTSAVVGGFSQPAKPVAAAPQGKKPKAPIVTIDDLLI
jgi:hypothetical protein